MDSEWSENSACFIVQDSQDETQFSQMNASKVLQTLTALKGASRTIADYTENQMLYSPRKSDLPESQGNGKTKKAGNNGQTGEENHPQSQGSGNNNAGGNSPDGGGGGGGAGGGGEGGGGGNPGGGGGGNGGGDDGGGEEDDNNHDDIGEDDGDHAEDGTPSTGGSSGSQPPALVGVEVGNPNVALGIQEHIALQHEEEEEHQQAEEANSSPVLPHENDTSSTGAGGGISDASTAVVTDTPREATPVQTSPGRHSSVSPRRGTSISPRRPVQDISSTHSTLSSLTSSSSDPQSFQKQPPSRKRLLPRRQHQPSEKRQKVLDISSDTSGRETSSSSKKDTTSTTTTTTSDDTSHDKSHDWSGNQGGEGGHGHDDDAGGPASQEDLFEDDDGQGGAGSQPQTFTSLKDNNKSAADSGIGTSAICNQSSSKTLERNDHVLFSTPAEKIGSLHLSREVLAAESIPDDEEESSDLIPPSQDVYDLSPPIIVPSTPTKDESNMSQFEDAPETDSEKPKTGSSSSNSHGNNVFKNFQEWQPSMQSYDSSTRSRPTSVVLGNSSSGKSKRRHEMTQPLESQYDVEIMSVSSPSKKKLESRSNTVTQGESVALDLQLNFTEQNTMDEEVNKNPGEVIEVSTEEESSGDVIVIEQEKTVIQIESSKSDEQKESSKDDEVDDVEHIGGGKPQEESSQELALHFSQSPTQQQTPFSEKRNTKSHSTSPKKPVQDSSLRRSDKSSSDREHNSNPRSQGFHLSIPEMGTGANTSNLEPGHNFQTNANRRASKEDLMQDSSDEVNLAAHIAKTTPIVQPSLTLDMIDTNTMEDDEEDSINVGRTSGFTLHRPNFAVDSDALHGDSENVNVFTKARDKTIESPQKHTMQSKCTSSRDSPTKELMEQVTSQQTERQKEKQLEKERFQKLLHDHHTQEDSEVTVKRKKTASKLEDSQECSLYREETQHESEDSIKDQTTVFEKEKLKEMINQATMEYEESEMETNEHTDKNEDENLLATQEYSYDIQIKQRKQTDGAADTTDENIEKKKGKSDQGDSEKRSNTNSKAMIEEDKSKSANKNSPSNVDCSSKTASNSGIKGSSISVMEKGESSHKKVDTSFKLLKPLAETPKSRGRGNDDAKEKVKTLSSQPNMQSSNRLLSQDETRLAVSDPYEYRLSQSQRDEQNKQEAIQLQDRARLKADLLMLPEPRTEQTDISNKDSQTKVISEEKATLEQESSKRVTDTRGSEFVPVNMRQSATRPHNIEQTAKESCDTCNQKSYHRVMYKTVTCHTVVIEEEWESGKVIGHKVINESYETISHDVKRDDDLWSSPSPSRTPHSLTSGDLADISSFSGSGPSNRSSVVKKHLHKLKPQYNQRTSLNSGKNSLQSSSSSCIAAESSRASLMITRGSSFQSSALATTSSAAPTRPDIAAAATQELDRSSSIQRKIDVTVYGSDSAHSDTVPIVEPIDTSSSLLQPAQVPPATTSKTSSSSGKKISDEYLAGYFSSEVSTEIGNEKRNRTGCGDVNERNRQSSSLSINNVRQSESLFSTVDDSESMSAIVKQSSSRRRSSGSAKGYSESLFTGSEMENAFVKPTDVRPFKHQTSSNGHKSSEKATTCSGTDTDLIPPTDTETAYPHKDRLKKYIRRSVEADNIATSGDDGDGERISPEIPVIAPPNSKKEASSTLASSGCSGQASSVVMLPPYWPTDQLEIGTTVLAMWKDKHYYPGVVVGIDKIRNKDVYQILFEDETQRNVKPNEVIVCELPAIGQKCLAESDDGWSMECTVIAHHKDAEGHLCTVQFGDGSTAKVKRKQLSLNKQQAENLVTAIVSSVPTTSTIVVAPENVFVTEQEQQESEISIKTAVVGYADITNSDEVTDISVKPTAATSGTTTPSKRGRKKKVKDIMNETKKEVAASVRVPDKEDYVPVPASVPPVSTTLQPDTSVFAMWRDKHYYPGHIKSQDKKNSRSYVVTFEDGDSRSVKLEDLIICHMIGAGHSILGEKDEGFDPGIVKGHYKQGESFGYIIEFDDQTEASLNRGSVILSVDQARNLIEDDGKVVFSVKASDLSLENLVEGKRERSISLASYVKESSGSLVSSSSKSTKGSIKSQTKGIEYSGKSTVKRKLGTPISHSTPTPKRRILQDDNVSGGPSPVAGLLDSPIQPKKSPRKSKHELFSHVKGPVPKPGSEIFKGMIFLLTHVDKTEEEQQKEREAMKIQESASTTDESAVSVDDEIIVPYDKEHLINQIEGGGGQVLQNLNNMELVSSSQCYLVSDSYQRTLKYLTCLALARPCVSHVWIKDCCFTGTLQEYKSYLLPAGLCLETDRLAELPWRPTPLKRMSLMLTSNNSKFTSTWKGILEAAGATLCDKLPLKNVQRDRVSAVITDVYVQPNIIEQAQKLNIPILSSEWIIQSLINGRAMTYSGHPHYLYNYDRSSSNNQSTISC